MRSIVNSILAMITCVSTLALAAGDEAAQLAPEPTVSVVWVYFFVLVFFGICAWFAYAIWNADKKTRAAEAAVGDATN
jgi:hypothetical protein